MDQKMFLQMAVALGLLIAATGVSANAAPSNDDDWDHLVVAQQWPQSNCEYVNETGQHTCVIPGSVTGWTMHGIWPSKGNTRGPNYCDPSMPFDQSQIQDILPQMKSQWPNLFTDTGLYNFWQHEWVKHGTCAASLDSLKGEHKYFSAGLAFNKKYDILSTLSKKGIVPSQSKTYNVNDVSGALQEEFGFATCLGCKYKQSLGQMMYQIYVCLDKNLSMIDCPICQRSCRSSEQLVYHPMDNKVDY